MPETTVEEREDIVIRFTYHPPQPGQPELYQKLRNEARDLALSIMESCPRSRECSLAITHLETAIFWANAAIARHG